MSDEAGISDHDFEIVLPFVVVASRGGPFDDQSFVAGFECGRYDALMNAAQVTGGLCTLLAEPSPVRTDNLPQLDLLAMHHGLTMQSTVVPQTPEWSFVVFTFNADA